MKINKTEQFWEYKLFQQYAEQHNITKKTKNYENILTAFITAIKIMENEDSKK